MQKLFFLMIQNVHLWRYVCTETCPTERDDNTFTFCPGKFINGTCYLHFDGNYSVAQTYCKSRQMEWTSLASVEMIRNLNEDCSDRICWIWIPAPNNDTVAEFRKPSPTKMSVKVDKFSTSECPMIKLDGLLQATMKSYPCEQILRFYCHYTSSVMQEKACGRRLIPVDGSNCLVGERHLTPNVSLCFELCLTTPWCAALNYNSAVELQLCELLTETAAFEKTKLQCTPQSKYYERESIKR